jgi:hypothetical protein
MVRHRCRLFQRAAVLEVGGDPVARKLWLPSLVSIPAAAARRWIAGSCRDRRDQLMKGLKDHAIVSREPRPICRIKNRCSRPSGTIVGAQNVVPIGNVRANQFTIRPFRACLQKPFLIGAVVDAPAPPTCCIERRPTDTAGIDKS